MTWHIGRTEAHREHIAAAGLIARHVRVYLPEIPCHRRCGRRSRNVLEPLFPGYLFLNLHPWDSWTLIRSVNGMLVHRPYLGNGVPAIISPAIVDAIKSHEQELIQGPKPSPFRVGQAVEVALEDHFGRLSELHAIIESLAKLDRQGRIKVGTAFLGQIVSMEVDASKVRLADASESAYGRKVS
jgi:transcriptional antiterminator RfaH